MYKAFESFFTLAEQYKRDVFEATASRLGTLPAYEEKDFWVCFLGVTVRGLTYSKYH